MPRFFDNKGNHVMPSLLTLAAVADGITEDAMQGIPTMLKREASELRQRLGVDSSSSRGEVLFAGDISSVHPAAMPPHAPQVEWYRPDGKTFHIDDPEFENYELGSRQSQKELTKIKEFLSSTKTRFTTIVLTHFEGFRCQLSDDGAAVAVADEAFALPNLCRGRVGMTSVTRLIIPSLEVCHILRFRYYLSWFPNLTSLIVNFQDITSHCESLLLFKDQLRELQLTAYDIDVLETQGFFFVIQELHLLQTLSIVNLLYYTPQDPINILDFLHSLRDLRSLTLMGVGFILASDVISFLVSEVRHRGKTVQRQAMMTDLTILNSREPIYEELYQSGFLTQEFKDRIFCDMDVNHSSSAMAHLLRRGINEAVQVMLDRRVTSQNDPCFSSIPRTNTCVPLLLKVIYKIGKYEIEDTQRESIHFELLCSDEKVQQYSPELLREAPTHFARKLDHRRLRHNGTFLRTDFLKDLVWVLRLLNRHVEMPSDIPAYLAMLVTIMDFSGVKFDVSSLFLRQAKNLPPTELAKFIEDHKKQLTCVAVQFHIAYPKRCFFTPPRLPKTTKISAKMAEMFTLIHKCTTDNDLQIAVEALLRASEAAAPSSSTQGVSIAKRRRQEEAHRVAAPLLAPGRLYNERRREEESHRVATLLLAPGRLYNHLYQWEKQCVPDDTNEQQRKGFRQCVSARLERLTKR